MEEETEHALFSRSSDLLRGFCGGFSADEDAGDGDSDEIDLGLSLGGWFSSSADSRQKRIVRSSSIPSILPSGIQPAIPLSRASSLPSGTMQSIGRVEAKRKIGERFDGDLEGGSMAKVRKLEVTNGGSSIIGDGPPTSDFCPAISSWIAGDTPAETSEKSVPPASQGSNASQGSSSPGGSELESRPGQGFGNGSEVRRVMAEHKNHRTPSSPSAAPMPKTVKDTANAAVGGGSLDHSLRKNDGGRRDDGRMAAEEMPLVSTRGDGRCGRRIQGFLYKCGRGEVRIVCVCHGSFLTPAEFVKHGGGGDVANPLKHIIVNPSSPSLL